MNFSAFGVRTGSPSTSSRANSPVRPAKRAVEEVSAKNDKSIRRYAATIEKTLATWEIAPEEWADYIAFLSRLLKAVQSAPPGASSLPHSNVVASKLAQCLNPGLPSGVHQKALDVYAFIFATFGKDHLSSQLHEYLPGLLPLLSFAALSVRPALYDLLEDYVVCLAPAQLRPVLKSFVLSIFPALEDETSEDFDRALTTITRLEHTFLRGNHAGDYASFYWQSIFLSVITSPTRRQGALNYLVRRLPKFLRHTESDGEQFTPEAEAAISPEPGLLIRAFACGLSDAQMLVQRGFLDMLTTHLPLESPLIQNRVESKDSQLLLSATMSILLRRDMSLNRRIWQWFLGPESKEDPTEHATTTQQLQYIAAYGIDGIETSLLSAFTTHESRPSERVKPFRIGLSLMDRWEIGGSIVPKIFLPALMCAYRYSRQASPSDMADFMKSANLFFDGVESKLIWSKLHQLLDTEYDKQDIDHRIQLLLWILSAFNVKEEEMTTVHAPLLALYTLNRLSIDQDQGRDSLTTQWHTVIEALVNITSHKALGIWHAKGSDPDLETAKELETIQQTIQDFYSGADESSSPPYDSSTLANLLLQRSLCVLQATMASHDSFSVTRAVNTYTQLLHKISSSTDAAVESLLSSTEAYLTKMSNTASFDVVSAIVAMMSAVVNLPQARYESTRTSLIRLEECISPKLLHNISPERSRYSVEATRLLWRLDTLLEDECVVQASIQRLVVNNDCDARKTSIRTFLNLWNLSMIHQASSAKSPMPGVLQRAVSSATIPDHDRLTNRMHTLKEPLTLTLDTLNDASDIGFEDVRIWLNSSNHTEAALLILFEQFRDALDIEREQKGHPDTKRAARSRADGGRALVYVLQHFNNALQYAQLNFWTVLSNTQLPGSRPDIKHPAVTALLEQCLMLLPGDDDHRQTEAVQSLAVSIVRRLFTAPSFVQSAIRVPQVGAVVAQRLLACVSQGDSRLQSSMLDLTVKALACQQRMTHPNSAPVRASGHARKMSVVVAQQTAVSDGSGTDMPLQLLYQLLKTGFSSVNCYPYLDSWLRFTEDMLPLLGGHLATVLIPLTETICAQVESIFTELMNAATSIDTKTTVYAPETTIARLLDGLELILRGAHEILLQEELDNEGTQPDSNGTVLSNMTPNMFKSQGSLSKTAKANSRLTAVLACKDVVRTCIKVWLWAGRSAEGLDVDRRSATTTAHHAIRLRNRSRHMLEGLFTLEPLESLEVVVAQWVVAQSDQQKDAVISLLHVLRDLRPKNTVPAILDALCSRTNPALLTPARQSTLTSDLSAADLVLLYSAYLASLEDDAVEEVWSDCTAFLRDVLSNPLPHRQILPALIWVIYQLAQKLERTNYGERKRMRRELGDNFQRLLAATFTALPSGSTEMNDDSEKETQFLAGLKNMNLIVILKEVIGRADLILETSDRVAVCISTVSTNLITPALRNKTFPSRIDADMLALVLRVAKKSPNAKIWRRDVADAFNDPRFLATSPELVERFWFPILQQWSLHDKERLSEIVARLYAPTGAGIMFGVGASAARLDADRKTQYNLRRISMLLLASPTDSHIEQMKALQEKMVELFEASVTSSPSSAIKAELFMLVRALLLSTSAVHFAPLWPIVNDNLQAALLGLNSDKAAQTNLSLLQACKVLDLLAALSPDEFQLFEWIYITNTTDAVYHQPDWHPAALSDKLGESTTGLLSEEDSERETSYVTHTSGVRGPMLVKGAGYDTEDIRAMAQDGFVDTALRPFLSQLSISLYESRYRMDKLDVTAFRRALVEDLQDVGTIVV